MLIRIMILAAVFFIPIPAGAQTDAECTAVYDSVGTRVGRSDSTGSNSVVAFEHQGRIATLIVLRDIFFTQSKVFFSGPNCTGDAFMVTPGTPTGPHLSVYANVVGSDVWYPDLSAADFSTTVASERSTDGICSNAGGTIDSAVPAYTFTLPTFVPPFHLEPESCIQSASVASFTPFSLLSLTLVLAFVAVVLRNRKLG